MLVLVTQAFDWCDPSERHHRHPLIVRYPASPQPKNLPELVAIHAIAAGAAINLEPDDEVQDDDEVQASDEAPADEDQDDADDWLPLTILGEE
jgi:hypothetical protein